MNTSNRRQFNGQIVAKMNPNGEGAPGVDSTTGTVCLAHDAKAGLWRVFVAGGALPDGRDHADFIPAPMALEYFLDVCRDAVVDAVELVEEEEGDAGTRETGGQS